VIAPAREVGSVLWLGELAMRPKQSIQSAEEIETAAAGQFTGEAVVDDAPAWEEISSGRYMPRRIKGSYRGRALG
jgi:hypothetical protein